MEATVVFAFSRGDAVKITANGIKAEVLALHENEDGTHEFLCRYTDKNGAVFDKWLKVSAINYWTE